MLAAYWRELLDEKEGLIGMERASIRISTITPIYNNAPYLAACIESLLGQTYDNIECIFVDDGSNDGSADIMRQYENHPKVKMIYKANNGGISSAYRAALPYVTGEVICFLDADDIARPDRAALTAARFEKDESIGIVYSRMELIKASGEPFGLSLELPKYLNNDNAFMQHFRRGFVTGSGMAFRYFPWLTFDRDIICNDYYITLQLLDKGYKIDYIDAGLTEYRIHGQNTSGQSVRLIQELCDIQRMYSEEYLRKKWRETGHSLTDIETTFGINSYYFRRYMEEAEQYFRASESYGGNAETYFYLGNLMYRQDKQEQSYRYFEQAYNLAPQCFHIEHNYGVLWAIFRREYTYAAKLIASAKLKQPYYLLMAKNEEAIAQGCFSELKLIHFISDDDAVYNTYCRLAIS